MPRNRIHRIFTYQRYGVTGKDIHRWMDKPSNIYMRMYRKVRNNYSMWIPNRFVRKYGLGLARAIAQSHIWLDKN
ncbi:hypothetical protein ACFL0D_07800, partial [Thermoproteota archaeon]